MKTKNRGGGLVPVFLLLSFLFAASLSQAGAAVTFRVVADTRTDTQVIAASLLDPTKVHLDRAVVLSANRTNPVCEFGFGVYPEENGVPIVLTYLRVRQFDYTVVALKPDGTLSPTYFYQLPYSGNWTTEASSGGCFFTTPSANSTVSNSPAATAAVNSTVPNVGALYRTKARIEMGGTGTNLWFPKVEEGYVVTFRLRIEAKYNGVVTTTTLAMPALTYMVSDKLPTLSLAMSDTVNGGICCIKMTGPNSPYYRLRASYTCGVDWRDLPRTALSGFLIDPLTGNHTWSLPRLQCQYFAATYADPHVSGP